MKAHTILLLLFALVLSIPSYAQPPSEIPEPGLRYVSSEALPLPTTILFTGNPSDLTKDAVAWKARGVGAFFLNGVVREWSGDIWATDGKPWTIGESDETFQTVRAANDACRELGMETFIKIAFDHHFEWFNDTAWTRIDNNFRQFAIFARDTGCTGITLDIEYVHDQYVFDWEGYDYDGYTRADLVAKTRERMTRVLQILYDEFPDMVFLTFPEQGLSLGQHIHVAWIEEAARRNAPGGVHYCTEYTYRNPNARYMFGHVWAVNDLFKRLLSERAWGYWTRQCTIASGVWPLGHNYRAEHEPGMSDEGLRQGYAASLMTSSRYNWVYGHNSIPQILGRGHDAYTGERDLERYLQPLIEREIIADPMYLKLAGDLRAMKARDYSPELGIYPAINFAGPSDKLQTSLIPTEFISLDEIDKRWELALRVFQGEAVNLKDHYHTVTDWMVIGPFPSDDELSGHTAVFGPEQAIDLNASYEGSSGLVRWKESRQTGNRVTVDLTKVYSPTENQTAYALCYVDSPTAQDVQLRIGTNDAGKMWLNGKLVYNHDQEGTALLDRDILPFRIPAGKSSVLIKVTNGALNWGFVFRITDQNGHALPKLKFTPR
jgi:hypothetical protein